jgi:hypothetical protein
MHPFGFNGIEPRTLLGQEKRQDTYPFASLLHELIMGTYPGTNELADVPGGMIPNQEPGGFAPRRQPLRAPLQKLGRDATHGTGAPHVFAKGMVQVKEK